jgi:hypothetical protein
LADESGNRSDRIAPNANRKQSRSSAANAALPPLARIGPFAVTHSMRTHRRQSARRKPHGSIVLPATRDSPLLTPATGLKWRQGQGQKSLRAERRSAAAGKEL